MLCWGLHCCTIQSLGYWDPISQCERVKNRMSSYTIGKLCLSFVSISEQLQLEKQKTKNNYKEIEEIKQKEVCCFI